jgi:hypothetical protein
VAFSKNEAVFLMAEVREWALVLSGSELLVASWTETRPWKPVVGLKTTINGSADVDLCFCFAPNGSFSGFSSAADQHDVVGRAAGQTPNLRNDPALSDDPAMRTLASHEI